MDDTNGNAAQAPVSRRVMGRALGVAAAGAVGSAALAGLGAKSAEAATNNAILAGETNTAESLTQLKYDGQAGAKMVAIFNDSSLDPSISSFTAAVAGWAGAGPTAGKAGVASGVYGFTDNGDGAGVVGSNHGDQKGGEKGAGVLGITSFEGGTAIKADASSVTNGTGVLAIGPSAIVAQTSDPKGFAIQAGGGDVGLSAGGATYGVDVLGNVAGVNAQGPTAVIATGNAIGVNANGPTGVRATGITTGVDAAGDTAVLAEGGQTGVDATGDTAVLATGAMLGIKAHGTNRGGVFSGTAAQVHLAPAGSTHPKNGEQGDLYADKTGRLWFCKKGGATATWHQIA